MSVGQNRFHFLIAIFGVLCVSSRVAAQPNTDDRQTPMMPLETQVGQMLFVGFSGTQPQHAGVARAQALAEAGQIGGLIVHNYNVESPKQLKQLIAAIHSWRTQYPLFVCVDQEGGVVQRLRSDKNFTDYPSAWHVGHSADDVAVATYDNLATELAELGFNMNFGPVVDLHDAQSAAIGARGRSFAETPDEVVHNAKIFIQAHRRANVVTAIKHFVGHGAAIGDTHQGFTDITQQYT